MNCCNNRVSVKIDCNVGLKNLFMWEPKRGYFCVIDLYVLYGGKKGVKKLECGGNNATSEKLVLIMCRQRMVFICYGSISIYMCALWYSKKLFASIVFMCERGGERGFSREKAVFRSAGVCIKAVLAQ